MNIRIRRKRKHDAAGVTKCALRESQTQARASQLRGGGGANSLRTCAKLSERCGWIAVAGPGPVRSFEEYVAQRVAKQRHVACSDLEAEHEKGKQQKKGIKPDKRAGGVIRIQSKIRSHRGTWANSGPEQVVRDRNASSSWPHLSFPHNHTRLSSTLYSWP